MSSFALNPNAATFYPSCMRNYSNVLYYTFINPNFNNRKNGLAKSDSFLPSHSSKADVRLNISGSTLNPNAV